jgi:beta-phosphoglucomutase-like phosphatase (HAD superfamily)
LQDELFRHFAADLQAVPYIHDALDNIALPACVASSGSHQRMQVSLGHTALYEKFAPNIFSASEVSNGKPAPDLFLHAAEKMKTEPERCLVVEDSIAGIAGARAAGMTVLGFHGGSHCRDGYAATLKAAGAHQTFDDMRQLPGLIARNRGPVAGFSPL